MAVKTNYTLNQPIIDDIAKKAETAMLKTADAIKTDIAEEQIVPKKTGHLEASLTIAKEGDSKAHIIYAAPYAARLYFHPEYNFSRDFNKNAKGRWLDDYLADGTKAKWVNDVFATFMRGEMDK